MSICSGFGEPVSIIIFVLKLKDEWEPEGKFNAEEEEES